jgi:hypothetical protein
MPSAHDLRYRQGHCFFNHQRTPKEREKALAFKVAARNRGPHRFGALILAGDRLS